MIGQMFGRILAGVSRSKQVDLSLAFGNASDGICERGVLGWLFAGLASVEQYFSFY